MTQPAWQDRVPLQELPAPWGQVLAGQLGYGELIQLLYGEQQLPWWELVDQAVVQQGAPTGNPCRPVPCPARPRSPRQLAKSRQRCRDALAQVLAPTYGIRAAGLP